MTRALAGTSTGVVDHSRWGIALDVEIGMWLLAGAAHRGRTSCSRPRGTGRRIDIRSGRRPTGMLGDPMAQVDPGLDAGRGALRARRVADGAVPGGRCGGEGFDAASSYGDLLTV